MWVKKKAGFFAILVFLLSFGIYSSSFKNELVWDDYIALGRIPDLSDSLSTRILFNTSPSAKYYRPIVMLSFVVDYKLWGMNPFGYHLGNVFFHSINSVLVFTLVLLIIRKHTQLKDEAPWMAFASALLFASHPSVSESVAWVSARTDVLCTTFFLSAFIFYIASKGYLYPVSIFFFILSLMTKETALVFPPLILAYHIFLSQKRLERGQIIVIFCFFAILLGYVLLRLYTTPVISSLPVYKKAQEIDSAILGLVYALGFYVKKLFFPGDYSIFIPNLQESDSVPALLFLGLLAASILGYVKWRWHMFPFFLLFVILPLLPALSTAVFKVATSLVAERYLYISTVGFSIFLAYTLFSLAGVFSKVIRVRRHILVAPALLLIFTLYLGSTLERIGIFKDNFTLWGKALREYPAYCTPRVILGETLLDKKMVGEAVRVFQLALKPDVTCNSLWRYFAANHLGEIFFKNGRLDKARRYWEMATQYNPNSALPYNGLGLLYLYRAESFGEDESLEKARYYFKEAVRIQPKRQESYFYLGKALMGLESKEEAKKAFRDTIQINPETFFAKAARGFLIELGEVNFRDFMNE